MPPDGFHTYAVTRGVAETKTFRDGKLTQTYKNDPPPTPPRQHPRTRPRKLGRSDVFVGPKLKIERAKRHIQELHSVMQAYGQSRPYSMSREEDTLAGQNVYRVRINKPLPIQMSAILADAVHNLRCVLDYLVCDCIRAAGGEPSGGSGLQIKREAKRLKPGSEAKLNGVSPTAERFFLRLKGRKGINNALYILHRLDIIDKHNAIVIVASAIVRLRAEVGMPILFETADGKLSLGGGGPGGRPFMMGGGTPDNFTRVFPLEDGTEIYRGPAGLNENIGLSGSIAFGRGQVAEGEPIIETLVRLTDFIERVIGVCERQCFRASEGGAARDAGA